MNGMDHVQLLSQALSDKCDGMPDHEISAALMEQGVSAEDAEYILAQLPGLAKQKLETAQTGMLTGLLLLLGGIGIRLISKNDLQVTVMDIASWVMAAIGVLKLLDGWYKRGRYRTLAAQS